MLVIFDGTGPANQDEYRAEFSNGFCSQIHGLTPKSRYYRGTRGQPPMSLEHYWQLLRGFSDVPKKAEEAILAIKAERGLGAGEPLFLCGYSRGAASALWLAHETKWPVKAMFLFDAVSRSSQIKHDLDVIPPNVGTVYHAIRNPDYTHRYNRIIIDLDMKKNRLKTLIQQQRQFNASRTSPAQWERELAELEKRIEHFETTYAKEDFLARNGGVFAPTVGFGNCAKQVQDGQKTTLVTEQFMGSHGALGGMP